MNPPPAAPLNPPESCHSRPSKSIKTVASPGRDALVRSMRWLGTRMEWLWYGFGTPNGTVKIFNVCRPWDGGTPDLPLSHEKTTPLIVGDEVTSLSLTESFSASFCPFSAKSN